MKSQRRHELQHNVLDAELARIISFFRKRGKLIAWCVFLIALVAFVYVYARSRSRRRELAFRRDFEQLVLRKPVVGKESLQRVMEIVEQDDNKRRASLACVAIGDYYGGASGLPDEPKGPPAAQRQEYLDLARQYYDRVIEEFPEQPAVAKAHYGLAVLACREGDLDTARRQFEQAMRSGPDTLAGREAGDKLDRMDDLAAPVPMRTAPLPTVRELASQKESPLRDVPLPSGFALRSGKSPRAQPAGGLYVFEGTDDPVAVMQFFRKNMKISGWMPAGEALEGGDKVLAFNKGDRHCLVKVVGVQMLKTNIEVRLGSGPAELTPATRPAPTTRSAAGQPESHVP